MGKSRRKHSRCIETCGGVRFRGRFQRFRNAPHRYVGPAQRGASQGHRTGTLRRRRRPARDDPRRHRSQRVPARSHRRHPLRRGDPLGRGHRRHLEGRPPQRRRPHQRRPAGARRRLHRSPRRARRPSRAPQPRAPREGARRGAHRGRASPRGAHDRRGPRRTRGRLGQGQRLQGVLDPQRGRRRGARARGRARRRGRVRHRCPGAALHRAERDDRRREGRRRDHRVGLDAVPVLHPEGADEALRRAGREGARRADGDGRRLRRQGGVPVDPRCPRGAPREEERAAREDRLRPRRGHGGDDQAPPLADASSHGRDARRQDRRARHRLRHRRRRVLDAVAGRPLARLHPRGRTRTTSTTSASGHAPSRPTRPRTAPSAASVRRSRSSRSSGTWTRSPRSSASPRRSCAAATSSARARRWRPGRWCATTSTWGRCSTARSG